MGTSGIQAGHPTALHSSSPAWLRVCTLREGQKGKSLGSFTFVEKKNPQILLFI